MSETRLAVQRALDKLITRFGPTSDVIGELRAALRHIDKEEAPASSRGMEAATQAEAESLPASAPAEDQAVEVELPPTQTSRKRSTGKGT